MFRARLLVLALAGCGRLGFDAEVSSDARAADGRPGTSCAFDLCDGFEGEAIDSSLWTLDPGVTRDGSVAHRGSASARMHLDARAKANGATAVVSETRSLASSRELWVRGWFRLSALPAAGNEVEVIGLAQSTTATSVHAVFVQADQAGFTLQPGISASTMVTRPTDTWFCLVWHAKLASSDGAIDLESDLFDGASATGGQTDTVPPISVLRFGARLEPTRVVADQPALDVWVDDVIVHSAPVSCAD